MASKGGFKAASTRYSGGGYIPYLVGDMPDMVVWQDRGVSNMHIPDIV